MKEFHGIALTVDARALIPRPETEVLVDTAIDELSCAADVRRSTGRARFASPTSGRAAAPSRSPLAVALRARRVPAGRRRPRSPLDVDRGRPGPRAGERRRPRRRRPAVASPPAICCRPTPVQPSFDVVLANLPYVRSGVSTRSAGPAVSPTFEPRLALDGGTDGLTVIGRLLDQLPRALAADGVALLEIGGDQGRGDARARRGAVARLGP